MNKDLNNKIRIRNIIENILISMLIPIMIIGAAFLMHKEQFLRVCQQSNISCIAFPLINLIPGGQVILEIDEWGHTLENADIIREN